MLKESYLYLVYLLKVHLLVFYCIGQTRLILLLVFHVLGFKDSSDMVKKCDWGQKVENQAQLGTKSPF